MKITKISTTVVNARMRNWIFVKVETDQPGLYGWGEATLEWKTKSVVGAVEDLAVLLVGQDPRRNDVVTEPIKMEGGISHAPTAPGLGIDINEQEAAKHPFQPEVVMPYFHKDGSVADW